MPHHSAEVVNHPVLGELLPYSERNNNVAFFLCSDGRAYTMTKDPVRLVDDVMRQILQPGIRVDKLYYAVYPPTLEAKTHPSYTGFIQDLRSLLEPGKVEELYVWEAQPTISASMTQMPAAIGLETISHRIRDLGGVYTTDVLQGFHFGLNSLPDKHFAILTGTSGTGKTSLVRRYAAAVHGLNSLETPDPLFFMCPVRPDWTDPMGLTGHFDIFSNKYVVPGFLQAVLTANAYAQSPVFVCLDELNLARVEYYLADVLSSMETRLPLRLHTKQGSVDSDWGVSIPPTVPWPQNLFIIGTINVDETTHAISDKVLDRAVLIDMSHTDFEPLFARLAAVSPKLAWSVDKCGPLLTQINATMQPQGLGFGYRVVREVVMYHDFAVRLNDEANSSTVLDQQLIQKVLVKLKGNERQRQMLVSLRSLLAGYPLSLARINKMIDDLAEGWFQATR